MMLSPSQEQSNSDADLTGVLSSYAIAPHSPASDHSDTIPDPMLLERELGHEELAAKEQATNGSSSTTISYEEALEREIEYQKRMKMIMLQHRVGSRLLPTPSQELSPKSSLAGIKRKTVHGELLEPAYGGMHDPSLPPEQLQDWQDAPQLLRSRQPSLQQLQDQRPLVQQSLHQKPLSPGSSSRQSLAPLPQHSQGRQPQCHQPLPRRLLNQQPPSSQESSPNPAFKGSHNPSLPSEQLVQFRQPLQDRWPPKQQSQHQNPSPNNGQPLLRQLQDRPPLQRQPQGQQPLPQPSHGQQQRNYQENPVWCHLCKVKCVTPHNLKIHCQGKKHKAKRIEVFGSKASTSSNG